MYDISKRKQFKTVKQLKEILSTLDDDTVIFVCGLADNFVHMNADCSLVSIDCEGLAESYEPEKLELATTLKSAAKMNS